MKRFQEPTALRSSDTVRPRADGERRFAALIKLALDESASALPASTLERLAAARKTALRAQTFPNARAATVNQLAYAGGTTGSGDRFGFGRASLVFSAIVLVGACLAGLYSVEQDHRIQELADMDSGVLNDDLPISAYADQGFNAFLKQNP